MGKTKPKDRLQLLIQQFPEESFLAICGHDSAIIGVEAQKMVLVYSVKEILVNLQQWMNAEEALEFFEFNIMQSHMGEKTPIFVFDTFD
jgi:hypothetical protein